MPSADTAPRQPVRTCVGCRARRPQAQLVRWAITAAGPVASRTAPGRGAWTCATNRTCVDTALRRKGFERAWKRPVDAETARRLRIAHDAMTNDMEN